MEEKTNYLIHYGVRGMKWRHRKQRPVSQYEYYSTHYNPVSGKPMYRQRHTTSSKLGASFKNSTNVLKAVGKRQQIVNRNTNVKRSISRGKSAVARLFGR